MTLSQANILEPKLQGQAGPETVSDTNIVSAFVTKSSGLNVSAVSVGPSAKNLAQLNGDWGKITFPVLAASGGALPPANQEHVFDKYVKNRQAWRMPESQGGRNLNDRADYLAALSAFQVYGREPACTAAYSSFIATEPMSLSTSTSLSYSDLGDGHHIMMTSEIIQNVSAGAQGFCCGGDGALPKAPGCLVHASKLQLLYWPPSHPNTACLGKTAASLINNRTKVAQITNTPHQLVSNLSVYAHGPDGYKFESPSIYVVYSSLFAFDRCGSVGPPRFSLTLAFEPGELSTVIYNATAKGTYTTLALDVNDLPCDPFRSKPVLVPQFNGNSEMSRSNEFYHISPPLGTSPFLALPSKIIDLVPAWSGCGIDPRGGYDPPRALSPATAMNPVHTVAESTAQSTAAVPSPLLQSLPNETGTMVSQPSPHYPDQGFSPIEQPPPEVDPPSDARKALTEASPPTNPGPTPGSEFPSIHQDDGPVVVPQTTNSPSVLDPDEHSSSTLAFVGDRSQVRDLAGVEHTSSPTFNSWNPGLTQQSNVEQPFATWSIEPGLTQKEDAEDPLVTWSREPGSIHIEDAEDPLVTWSREPGLTRVENIEDPLATWSREPALTRVENSEDPLATWSREPGFTRVENAGGSRATGTENAEFTRDRTVVSPLATKNTKPNPPAVAIQGQTITNDAAPMTIGGAKVAYQSGILSVDSQIQPVPLSTKKGSKHTNLVIVGGLSVSILPAAAQSDLTHPVENIPGAASLIDKVNIPPGNHQDAYTYITVGGQTFTLQSNAIQIAGKTLEPGDPAITVDGTPIFLGASDFVVGTRTEVLSLPTTSAIPETVLTAGDKIFTPKGSTIVVAGVTITAGEPATTIDGIPISLGSSMLFVGPQTRSFAYPTDTMGTDHRGNLDALIVSGSGGIGGGDKIFTLKGSTIVVAGVTITLGEPAATIEGIPISLRSSVLVVGSQIRSFANPTNTMGTENSDNLDALIVSGLGGIDGGVVDGPSSLKADTKGTSSAKSNTPLLGQTVNLCVPARIYLAWAILSLTVFLIWS